MVPLPREYKNSIPTWFPIAFGCVFGGVGLLSLCLGIGTVWFGGSGQFKLTAFGFGAVFLCLGIGFAIQMHWNYTRHAINCTPAGFAVTSESKRRGSSRGEYRWDEITGTRYEEIITRRQKGKRTTAYFSVDTARGPAFKVDHNQGAFDEMITLFNEQTPHLPYIWVRENSFADTISRAFSNKPAYNRIPRSSPSGPPPLPPPLPPSM